MYVCDILRFFFLLFTLMWLESNFYKSENENQSTKNKAIFHVILY